MPSALKIRLVLLGFLTMLFVACEKKTEDGLSAAPMSITDQIASSNAFSILHVALVKAGMETLLDTPGTFTFFAPNDAVMIASGFTLDKVQQLSGDSLRKILSYHLLKTRLFEADFKLGVSYNEITFGGDSTFALRNDQGLYVNGIKMLYTDFIQSNGLIHIPSKVFHLPIGDLLEVVAADTSLSLFNAALLKSANGGTNLTNALVCGCKFTLFAPNNTAFKNAGYPDLAAIENAPYQKIVALLSYHITKERVFSSDFTHDLKMQMIDGRFVQVQKIGNDYLLKGEFNKEAIFVTKQNTMAIHGLVHVIDKLLE